MRGGGASLDRTARARPFDPPPTLTVPPSRRSSGRQPHLVYDTEAGALKRADADTGADVILLRSIRDMNMPKFVAQDMPLFNALMSDLFPGVEPPVVDYGALQAAIEAELDPAGLQRVPGVICKCIQTYESKLTRHGNMLVGASLGGKTTARRPEHT